MVVGETLRVPIVICRYVLRPSIRLNRTMFVRTVRPERIVNLHQVYPVVTRAARQTEDGKKRQRKVKGSIPLLLEVAHGWAPRTTRVVLTFFWFFYFRFF